MRFAYLIAALLFVSTSQADTLQQAQEQKKQNHNAEVISQKKVDKLDDERYRLIDKYRSITSQTEQLQQYNQQLRNVIDSQQIELKSIQTQIENIDTTERGILPLMNNMLMALEKFIQLDAPFLLEERTTRLNNLKSLLPQADIAVAEKYRRILEAYQIEVEYGRTLESYQDTLDDKRLVNFLRLGRVALYYQTLDGQNTFLWAPTSKQWTSLESSMNRTIRQSIRVAKQQVAPQMLKLSVSTESIK
jgi:hypothetical protein